MIKWTVKDCLEHLKELKNPFEKIKSEKPKLSDVMASMNRGEHKV